jgi:hypothetical protein
MSVPAMSSLNIQKEENARHVTGHCEHSGDRVGTRRFFTFSLKQNHLKVHKNTAKRRNFAGFYANLP